MCVDKRSYRLGPRDRSAVYETGVKVMRNVDDAVRIGREGIIGGWSSRRAVWRVKEGIRAIVDDRTWFNVGSHTVNRIEDTLEETELWNDEDEL